MKTHKLDITLPDEAWIKLDELVLKSAPQYPGLAITADIVASHLLSAILTPKPGVRR